LNHLLRQAGSGQHPSILAAKPFACHHLPSPPHLKTAGKLRRRTDRRRRIAAASAAHQRAPAIHEQRNSRAAEEEV